MSVQARLDWSRASQAGPRGLGRLGKFPKQCLHNGVLTFRVKELVAGRNGARSGGAGPWFRRWRCGFARIPEFQPLLASGGGHLGCGPQRRTRWGGAFVSTLPRIPLRFEALPLWFRANSGLSGPFWLLLGGPLRLRAATAHAVRREFVSMLPLWFRANCVAFRCSRFGFVASSGLFWGGHLGFGPQRRTRWGGAFVSMLSLWFRANSVAFRRCRCDFARIPLRFDRANTCLFWPLVGGPCA